MTFLILIIIIAIRTTIKKKERKKEQTNNKTPGFFALNDLYMKSFPLNVRFRITYSDFENLEKKIAKICVFYYC